MKRKRFDAETKVTIVLEGLRGETFVTDLCRKHQISEAMYRWRDRLDMLSIFPKMEAYPNPLHIAAKRGYLDVVQYL